MLNFLFHTLPLNAQSVAEFLPLKLARIDMKAAPNFSPLTPNFSPLTAIFAEFLPSKQGKVLKYLYETGGNTILEH